MPPRNSIVSEITYDVIVIDLKPRDSKAFRSLGLAHDEVNIMWVGSDIPSQDGSRGVSKTVVRTAFKTC